MMLKTTYQSYFSEYANIDCLIWGYGHEQRNSIDVFKMWFKNNRNAKFIVFIEKNYRKTFDKDIISLDFQYGNLLVIEFDNKGLIDHNHLKEFITYLDSQNDTREFTIDVTGVSREHLLIILHLLRTTHKSNIKIVYISCEYGKYSVENYTLPQNNKFFEGKPVLGQPTAMILLAGYENMACKVLINAYQPNKLFIGFSDTPIESNQNLPERASVDMLTQDYIGEADMTIEEFEYKANDFSATYKSLCDLVKKYHLENEYNIILSSCTSKLATIGMYLFHEDYPETQYVYTIGKKKDISQKMLNVFEIPLSKELENLLQ